MNRVLVLGATGRAGAAIITELPADVEIVAALRAAADADRLPASASPLGVAVVDLDDPAGVRAAAEGADVVVNAIRLREDIAPDALVDLHESIRDAVADDAWIVTVGGAGSLRLPGGRRFWEHPAFPPRTLPRGIAHARLRDHLESGATGTRWAYLIPPPAFDPNGSRTGRYETKRPPADEAAFAVDGSISYTDFAVAAARHAAARTPGTLFIQGT